MKQSDKSKWVNLPPFVVLFFIKGTTKRATIQAYTEANARKIFKRLYPKERITKIEVRYGQLQ